MINLVKYNRPKNIFNLMDSFFRNYPDPIVQEKEYAPLVNIYEKENDFFIDIQMPGMKKEDVKVEIKNKRLFVSGKNSKKDEIKEDNYYRREIFQGKFIRSFDLPDSIDKNKLEAKFVDGILKIKLPKFEEEMPKQININ